VIRRLACLVAFALALSLAVVAHATDPTVILISLDGTRPDVAAKLSTFARIAREGASAEAMQPSFPSNTFPNHVTLVTGVEPDRHGIVNNTFRDPERGRFSYGADPTWIEVEPLWSLVGAAGVVSASYHWVGSEGAWRSGRAPRHWKPFDTRVAERAKVEQILAWLDLPDPATRPRLVTAWFHGADGASHRYGPASAVTAATLAQQNEALAALLDGLVARDLLATTTLLLVSDHGMAATRDGVDLARALADAKLGARVTGGGGLATISLRGARDREARTARVLEVARSLGLEAWPRGECPPPYACASPRFGDVVVVAPVGVEIARPTGWRRWLAPLGLAGHVMAGVHGHRPEAPEMAALFAAVGRGVTPGARLGTVRAIDVAPTVLALLDLPIPSWMEGAPIPLDARSSPSEAPR
jgi:arylsulfatase A-like enzyme